jgi:hypothetical protein
MPTFYLDYEQGNDNHSGTSFALLASGSDGAISTATFSSATANFPNDNTIAPLKNLCWYSDFWFGYGQFQGCRLLSTDTFEDVAPSPPSGISPYIYHLQEYPGSLVRYFRAVSLAMSNSSSHTISVYVRPSNRNKFIMQFNDSFIGGTTKGARFNLSNGTVEQTGSNATASIVSAGNGWYRTSITVTSSAQASTDTITFGLVSDSNSGLDIVAYDADSTKGIYFCGVQVEAGSSMTTYEKPPGQCLSIFNGSIYALYHITGRVSSTSLTLLAIVGGTALANTSARQYFIGGRWQTFTNGATALRIYNADIIRVEASPDPTSIGNATWNGEGSRLTVAISSSTNASPIAITTSATHNLTSGDTVFIYDHVTNTNAIGTWEVTVTGSTTFTLNGSTGNGVGGATGTVRKANNCVIRLASALTENIASIGNAGEGRTAWIATTNNTASTVAATKQGSISDTISVGAVFTTGLVAYKAFSTKNLSGYQQLSFWIQQTAGTIGAANSLSLVLCSDSAGATAVNTFNLPSLAALNVWTNITIDLNTNLGSSIQSIGFYVNTDNGAQAFSLSNIIACKAKSSADSLTLTSLLGKNTANESWQPIQSINGTRVIIDGRVSTTSVTPTVGNFPKGYYGTSETVNTFKLEPIRTPLQSAAANIVHNINRGFSSFTPAVFIEGGYDRTNMSTQSGISFFDGGNGLGYGLNSAGRACVNYNKLGFVRYDRLFFQNVSFNTFKNFHVIACTNNFNLPTASQNNKFVNVFCLYNNIGIAYDFGFNINKFTNCYFNSNNLRGMDLTTANVNVWNNCYWNNNGSNGMLNAGGGANNTWNNCSFINNQSEAYRTQATSSNDIFNNCITSGNALPAGNGIFSFGGTIYLNNSTMHESVEVGFYTNGDGRVYSQNHDNTSGNHYLFADLGIIRPQTSVRYSNSGFAWSLSPTSDFRRESYPLGFPIGQVAVSANSLVTIRAWMRRTSAGLTFRLRVKGGQIAGVANDVISYMTATADTWEQVSLSFTPTEAGVVEILAECWGGATFTGYVDDLTIIQI